MVSMVKYALAEQFSIPRAGLTRFEYRSSALGDNTALVIQRDHYLDAVQYVGGLVAMDPGSVDRWRSTTMRLPEQGWTREFEIAQGFDIRGQSYVDGTETEVQSVFFTCDN